jgi:tetratricopeptide (TPR) repeat protein
MKRNVRRVLAGAAMVLTRSSPATVLRPVRFTPGRILKACRTIATAAWMSTLAISPVASADDDVHACSYDSDANARIAACTRAIGSRRYGDSDLADLYLERALAYSGVDKGRSIADYTEAIRLNPENELLWIARGDSYLLDGDLDRSLADYNEAIRRRPDNHLTYYSRARVLEVKGEFERAAADFIEAMRLVPEQKTFRDLGRLYQLKGDLDRSIAEFTRAIREDDSFQGVEYSSPGDLHGRGLAYLDKGDVDRAIGDFDETIRRGKTRLGAYNSYFNNRGLAYQIKGDLSRAVADFTEAVRGGTKYAVPYLNRALVHLSAGSAQTALTDLNQASVLEPKNAYVALWLHIAAQRANSPSRLADAVAQIDLARWPGPIVRAYLGQLTTEALLAAAGDPDPRVAKSQVCEANFYSGELALLRGAKDEAVRLFRLAAAGCPKNVTAKFNKPHFVYGVPQLAALPEGYAAVFELKALNLRP